MQPAISTLTLRTVTRCALAISLLLAPFSAPFSASAQTQSPPFHGLAHVAIRVNDVAASRDFYQKLGFEQFFAFEKNGVPTESFIKVNDRQFIELYPKEQGKPIGFLHLCFDGDDLNALHDFDVAQGLTPTPVRKAGAGNLLFTLRGPEDQNIEYTQYMPGSRHSEDRGKHLGPNRIADNFFAVALGMKDVPAANTFYTGELGFSTIHPNLLLIPGSANQQVLIEQFVSPRSRIFLLVPNLKKASAELKKQGIAATHGKHKLTVTDPDGNLLVFTSKQVAD
jgi:catechol 2,3-dioxygenase-like lactoylglutathione lyase family enzyme